MRERMQLVGASFSSIRNPAVARLSRSGTHYGEGACCHRGWLRRESVMSTSFPFTACLSFFPVLLASRNTYRMTSEVTCGNRIRERFAPQPCARPSARFSGAIPRRLNASTRRTANSFAGFACACYETRSKPKTPHKTCSSACFSNCTRFEVNQLCLRGFTG